FMDNQAFELQGEKIPNFPGRNEKSKFEEKKGNWSMWKIFFLCFLACLVTTIIGILALSLVMVHHTKFLQESIQDFFPVPSQIPEKVVERKFQFLNHLSKSKIHKYPGGEIQWARFRRDFQEYQTEEEMEFGKSLNSHRSQITFGTLRIRSKGLRIPHWHFNANEHGYLLQGSAWVGVIGADDQVITTYNVSAGQVIFFPRNTIHWLKNVGKEDCLFLLFFSTHEELLTLDMDDAFFATPEDILARALKGSAWVGVIGADDQVITTYNVSAGQVIFFPRNTIHWLKNVGKEDCLFLLFFSTHEELLTLDMDDAFFATPEDILARALKPQGGVKFIRTFLKPQEDQTINLPPNLDQLIHNSTYTQSPDHLVWQFFYDLQGSMEYPFPGGIFQWARYRKNTTGLTENQKIFSESLHKYENTLTLATLRIFTDGLGQPHFHFNANELGYVVSGCGQLETLGMKKYFHGTSDHILAQIFSKDQEEFKKFPKPA
ncbi:PREDICTED: uncharacterized protein LOC103803632, partial [Acanthisitta chloris]|uniref:uncharacterized protein LOC103803632 n=1 Tax=Acanthisitta chloris TaxID=57068 RepID=UPI0004F0E235